MTFCSRKYIQAGPHSSLCSLCGRVPDVRHRGPLHRGGEDHTAEGHCPGAAVPHGEEDIDLYIISVTYIDKIMRGTGPPVNPQDFVLM